MPLFKKWKKAVEEGTFRNLAAGEYPCKLNSAKFKKSKTKKDGYQFEYEVVAGSLAGRTQTNWFNLSGDQSMDFFIPHCEGMGIDIESIDSDEALQEAMDDVAEDEIVFVLSVTQQGQFTNMRATRVLEEEEVEDWVDDEDPPEFGEGEDEESGEDEEDEEDEGSGEEEEGSEEGDEEEEEDGEWTEEDIRALNKKGLIEVIEEYELDVKHGPGRKLADLRDAVVEAMEVGEEKEEEEEETEIGEGDRVTWVVKKGGKTVLKQGTVKTIKDDGTYRIHPTGSAASARVSKTADEIEPLSGDGEETPF